MKKTTTMMLCLAAACACGDTKITWLADVTADRAETVTGAQSNSIAAAAAHIPRNDNPHGVTAVQIGALTAEQDLAALRAYHYGSPDIVESPAGWFVFDGAGTITGFNWSAGRENVVIPWAIGGVPVTTIGGGALQIYDFVSVIAPQTVTSIGANAFAYCTSLTSVHMGQNAPEEATDVFSGITPPPNVYVTDPHATCWGATWNGAPVVRPPLYADAIYQAGELVATTGHVAQALASQLPGIVYSNSVSALTIYTNASGAATSWWQVASGVTNSGTFASGTPGAITNGQSKIYLSDSAGNSRIGINTDTPLAMLHVNSDYFGRGIRISFADSDILYSEITWNQYNVFGTRMSFNDVSGQNVTFCEGGGKAGFGLASPAERLHVVGNGLFSGTNTAAEVRSTGGYIIGPTIGGKQAQLFTDGTNCFFVNVNNVTNALTTN